MEGPGGYQFVGRTLQMWNPFHTTREFSEGTPWLLRFFDELRFYPVGAEELLEIRAAFPRGHYPLRIEPKQFRLREYHGFLQSITSECAEFKKHQQAAFEAERERWAAAGQKEYMDPPEAPAPTADMNAPEGCRPVRSPVVASVWNVAVEPGQRVEAGQKLIILEAMKTEIAVAAPHAGIVEKLTCAAGAMVWAGQTLLFFRAEAAL
jgi:urea carboxylase